MHGDLGGRATVLIEPWGPGDLPLLQKCLGDQAMMEHLGGPESPEKIADRQRRYERLGSRQFKIVDGATGAGVGWVGYWGRAWRGGAGLRDRLVGDPDLSGQGNRWIGDSSGDRDRQDGTEPPVPTCVPVGR